MFKIAAVLRQSQAPNIFRRAILGAFSSGIADECLLCSGFFQEKKYKINSYYSSQSFAANSPSILCQMSVTTVGVYNKPVWGSQYDAFTKALSSIPCRCGCGKKLNVKKRVQKGSKKWHAKVFIARSNGAPRLAVIGSSNITKNAFDEMAGWNRECDVLIWNASDLVVNSMIRTAISGVEEPAEQIDNGRPFPDVFLSSYDARDPLNTRRGGIQARLGLLWQDVLDASTEV